MGDLFVSHTTFLHYSIFLESTEISTMIKTIVALFALVASASAFAPQQPTAFARSKIVVFGDYGKYDEQLWDMDAKLDVYNTWDPNSPRSAANFNPFETYEGNSPDASGFYPGEGRYKDPVRPDVNFAAMQAERKILDDIAANPKASPGCPGCRT